MRKPKRRCPACERPFKSEQAVRAHLRFCSSYAYRRRREHAEHSSGMPEAGVTTSVVTIQKSNDPEVIRADPAKVLGRRSGRQSQEGLMLLLDIDEVFPKLKD